MDKKIQVYAILRYDKDFEDFEIAITVVSILPEIEMAESEVKRLNELNADKNYIYYWCTTRYYPEGRKVISKS